MLFEYYNLPKASKEIMAEETSKFSYLYLLLDKVEKRLNFLQNEMY